MIKISKHLNIHPSYSFSEFKKSDILFFDIETTGFSPANSIVYLIGAAYYSVSDKCYKLIQWFTYQASEETEMISDFMNFARSFKALVHYNGSGFDIPYLTYKCDKYSFENNLSNMKQIDLYKIIQPYKSIVKLDNYKQKTIEGFLGIERNDKFTGGELISTFHEYVKLRSIYDIRNNPDDDDSESEELLNLLLNHNICDLTGLFQISKMINYSDLFVEDFIINDINDDGTNLIINCTTLCNIPKQITYTSDEYTFCAFGSTINFEFRIHEDELKFFYSNYKDYYYLPVEDCAIHKSVAGFVDKNYKQKATASNCYTRKKGRFLKQFSSFLEPCFKYKHNDKHTYFELNDKFLSNNELLLKYIKHMMYFSLRLK